MSRIRFHGCVSAPPRDGTPRAMSCRSLSGGRGRGQLPVHRVHIRDVFDPELPQRARESAHAMTGALLAIIGVATLALMCCAVWSYTAVVAAPVSCDDEPPKYKKREYERWQRECEERNRNIMLQNQVDIPVQPQGLRITLGLGGDKRRTPVEGQRLLS